MCMVMMVMIMRLFLMNFVMAMRMIVFTSESKTCQGYGHSGNYLNHLRFVKLMMIYRSGFKQYGCGYM